MCLFIRSFLVGTRAGEHENKILQDIGKQNVNMFATTTKTTTTTTLTHNHKKVLHS